MLRENRPCMLSIFQVDGAVFAYALLAGCVRRVCDSVKTTFRRGIHIWQTFWCEYDSSTFHPFWDRGEFAWHQTTLHMYPGPHFRGIMCVEWRTSFRFVKKRSPYKIVHSCSTCPGAFETVIMIVTILLGSVRPNARRIMKFIVRSPFRAWIWGSHIFQV